MHKLKYIRLKFITVLVILFFNSGIADSQTNSVQQKITGWKTFPGFANTSICLNISDSQTGEVLFFTEPQLSLVPASILKLVTTAAALEVFGPEYRFFTTLSYSGIIRNDTLFGDLQIIGGGDPTLGSAYFPEQENFQKEWIGAIQHSGIKTITGNLILDASVYESQMIPNTWIWEDLGNYFGAGASGISVFDNQYEIHLKSGDAAGSSTLITKIVPKIPNLEIQNEVLSSDLQSDQAYVFGSPMENRRIIRGTIPKGRNDFVVKASVPDPAALLASEFRKKLATSQISISGETRFEKVNPEKQTSTTLFVTKSPELKEIIRITNHESVNLFAEHLLKHLAFQEYGLGSTKDGCRFISEFWKKKGIDLNGFFMNDGSGLSRFNAITASQMVAIINYMKTKSMYSEDFYESLPSPGNGTLSVFSSNKFPDHCLHTKSGSMTRVRCYAGYLTTVSGRQLSFAILLNNFSCSQSEAIRKIEEVLVELLKM
ncbi:MAG: D-alanyl-D-alanine carboxypeptidase/D-alanyl-D-alanine-endopeptidase [Prolixibacteraceae bacterium]